MTRKVDYLRFFSSCGEKRAWPCQGLRFLPKLIIEPRFFSTPPELEILNFCRGYYRKWRALYCRLSDLSDAAEDYVQNHTEVKAAQCLRTWRMRIFQLRGPAMQADLFNQRSKRLKLRLMFRIWREKLKSKDLSDNELSNSVSNGLPDRAHTAPLTPTRSTRRYLWRNLNSR